MKKLILCAAVVIAAMGANAQKAKSDSKSTPKSQFSIGVEGSLPIGDFAKAYSFGFGGSVQGDFWVAPELALTANVGYISYSGKSVTTTYTAGTTTVSTTTKYPSNGLVPVLAGIKYKFGGSMVYASAQLGAAFSTQSGGGSSFAYAPGIGFNFSPNFDALLKYQGYSSKGGNTSSAVGLRLAYTLGH